MRLRLLVPVLGILMTGCGAGIVELPLDVDQDGLLTNEEVEAGTDPTQADSDGDGFTDADELKSQTDPNDGEEHPYLRGWPMDDCRGSIVSTGNSVGQVAENFELMDRDGNMVRLHDFCNQTVLLVSGAFW